MLDVTILQRTVPGNEHQEVATCFRLENEICFRCGVLSLIACKPRAGCDERYSLMHTCSDGRMYCPLCNPSCVGIKVKLLEAMAASMDGDHLCRDCDGTGWVLYRSETEDGEFEEAYHLCPKGHAPRYCMGFSSDHLCYRPATVRCGPGYYCKEHVIAIHEGRDVSDPFEAI